MLYTFCPSLSLFPLYPLSETSLGVTRALMATPHGQFSVSSYWPPNVRKLDCCVWRNKILFYARVVGSPTACSVLLLVPLPACFLYCWVLKILPWLCVPHCFLGGFNHFGVWNELKVFFLPPAVLSSSAPPCPFCLYFYRKNLIFVAICLFFLVLPWNLVSYWVLRSVSHPHCL